MVTSDHWYKNAIIYNLNVDKFQDSNGDGVGDFSGLTRRLDYLAGLGVNCLWLQPFYPSPLKDNGYDITDYYNIHPRFGSLGDFVEFMQEARERGIRVLADLVVNHTSDQHPWFQAARSDPKSRFRDWYVWTDEPDKEKGGKVAFPGEQESIWAYDEKAELYYLHHFYKFQPDLNINNPEVRDEIKRIIGFWIQLGVSGFRVDAAPFLIEDTSPRGQRGGGEKPRFEFLSELREFLDRRRGDAVLLAEANVPLERMAKYFGQGARFHMLFDFYLNQHMFLALAQQKARPLVKCLRDRPREPEVCQWAIFIRNHDELNLDQLSDKERQEVFDAFEHDPSARIFEGGLRRRFPPMVEGDRRRIELGYSMLFTLPGTPVMRYGQEIGMGDDLSLPGREAVRTVMQWTSDEGGGVDCRNAGFSTAPPEQLIRPVITEGPFAASKVNVRDQERSGDSLLNTVERMIRARKHCPEFGWGDIELIELNNDHVFAICATWHNRTVAAVHNLRGEACQVKIDLGAHGGAPLEDVLGNQTCHPTEGSVYQIELGPYGYRWFRVGGFPPAI